MGGGEVNLLSTILSISKNKQFKAFLFAPQGPLSDQLKSSVPIYPSKGIGRLNRKEDFLWPLKFIYRYIYTFLEFRKALCDIAPDLIYIFSETSLFYTVIPSKLFGIKTLCELQFIVRIKQPWPFLSKLLGFGVDKYIAVSSAVKGRLVEVGHPSGKIDIVRSGIDIEHRFNPKNVSNEIVNNRINTPSGSVAVGIIGSICYLKGQQIFLEAVHEIEKESKNNYNVFYYIIGEPMSGQKSYFNELLDYINSHELKNKVSLPGQFSHEDMPEVISKLDVVVFASILPDALPLSIMESMAMERIVIASEIGGVPEIIENGKTGFLYEPGNSMSLSEKLSYIIDNFESLRSIGVNGRSVIKRKFSQSAFNKRLVESLAKAVTNYSR